MSGLLQSKMAKILQFPINRRKPNLYSSRTHPAYDTEVEPVSIIEVSIDNMTRRTMPVGTEYVSKLASPEKRYRVIT